MLAIFSMFPESQAKMLANSYIGELGRKYSRKDHGFTCSSLDTPQCIWTTALAENRDVIIDSYQNPNTKQELYLVREQQIERIFSDNNSINRIVISQSISKCLNMMWDNWSHKDGKSISQLYAINTDDIFITSPKYQHPNKKDVKFDIDSIGQIVQPYILRNIGKTPILKITLIMLEMVQSTLVVQDVVRRIDYAKRH